MSRGAFPITTRYPGWCCHCKARIAAQTMAIWIKAGQAIAHIQCHTEFERAEQERINQQRREADKLSRLAKMESQMMQRAVALLQQKVTAKLGSKARIYRWGRGGVIVLHNGNLYRYDATQDDFVRLEE